MAGEVLTRCPAGVAVPEPSRLAVVAVGLEGDERRSDRDDVARFAAELDDRTRHRR
jgi:hypothetical protein